MLMFEGAETRNMASKEWKKAWTFYWACGAKEVHHGVDVEEAFENSGYPEDFMERAVTVRPGHDDSLYWEPDECRWIRRNFH